MFVLSRTVWVRNSLFITVEGEMFSLVKISGKLYKSCMCLILSQSCRCLYIALSLSVSACSCVRTSKVLFVLPIYEELQPEQEHPVRKGGFWTHIVHKVYLLHAPIDKTDPKEVLFLSTQAPIQDLRMPRGTVAAINNST